jgi:hypothetical protein
LLARFLPALGWAAAGAAATITLFPGRRLDSLAPPERMTSAAIGESFEPVEASQEVLGAMEEGLIYETGTEAFRRVRLQSRERHAWRNTTTGARIEVEVPREDIFAIPVSLQ